MHSKASKTEDTTQKKGGWGDNMMSYALDKEYTITIKSVNIIE